MSAKKRRIKRKIKLASKAFAFAFFAGEDRASNWKNLAIDWKVRKEALRRRGVCMSFSVHRMGTIALNRVYL